MSVNPYGILGSVAPELKLNDWYDDEGSRLEIPVRLAMLDDAVKIIYCFQSWCPGCHRAGFPTLKRLLSHFKQDLSSGKLAACAVQTVFEGYESNTLEALHTEQKRYALGIPFAQDERRPRPAMMTDYRTGGTPWIIVLDCQNRVIYNDFHIDYAHAVSLLSKAMKGQGEVQSHSPRAVAHDDTKASRYTVRLTESETGYVQYRKKGKVRYLDHAEVPVALRGQSYAGVMMETVLEKIESQGLKIIPVCGFTQHYLRKYTRWSKLLA